MGVARAPGGVLAILAVGSLGLVVMALAAPGGPRPVRTAQVASVALTDDDGEQALFPATELVPGRPVSRCLAVSYAGPAAPGDVHLVADDVTGALADGLQVQVERGTGGGFASCAGFVGSTVFDGTLIGLVDPAEVGVSTGWVPAAADGRTYRITVAVPAGTAPGGTAAATFRWLVVPGTTASPTTAPTPVPSTGPSATPDASPSATPTPAPVGRTPRAPGTSGGQRRTPGGGLRAVVGRVFAGAYRLAVASARHGGIPIAALLAVVLFVLVQDQIDRRDPKLALAPMTTDRYVYFDDQDGDPGGTP